MADCVSATAVSSGGQADEEDRERGGGPGDAVGGARDLEYEVAVDHVRVDVQRGCQFDDPGIERVARVCLRTVCVRPRCISLLAISLVWWDRLSRLKLIDAPRWRVALW